MNANLSRIRYAILRTLVLLFSACGRSGPPYGPDEALKTIRVEKGFRIETFATEPAIT